jgi:trimethylguanosine synthase
MTDTAWYGVTQERVAAKIAGHVALTAPVHRSILIDAFCGVGGNTIAFALSGRWKRIYAIEKDAATLECARRNAEIYGVKDKITWFLGDCFELLREGEGAIDGLRELASEFGIIFGSPPWGGKWHWQIEGLISLDSDSCPGPTYRSAEIFDLNAMQPYSFTRIVRDFRQITDNIVLYLPRTSDLRQIGDCMEDGKKCQVIHYCTKENSRALCVYLGDFSVLT